MGVYSLYVMATSDLQTAVAACTRVSVENACLRGRMVNFEEYITAGKVAADEVTA